MPRMRKEVSFEFGPRGDFQVGRVFLQPAELVDARVLEKFAVKAETDMGTSCRLSTRRLAGNQDFLQHQRLAALGPGAAGFRISCACSWAKAADVQQGPNSAKCTSLRFACLVTAT